MEGYRPPFILSPQGNRAWRTPWSHTNNDHWWCMLLPLSAYRYNSDFTLLVATIPCLSKLYLGTHENGAAGLIHLSNTETLGHYPFLHRWPFRYRCDACSELVPTPAISRNMSLRVLAFAFGIQVHLQSQPFLSTAPPRVVYLFLLPQQWDKTI